jgi:hypothetical protein
MLDILDLEGRREAGKYPSQQGGFDLIWDSGALQGCDPGRPTSLPSMLGCYNPHDANQLRQSLEFAGDGVTLRAEEGDTEWRQLAGVSSSSGGYDAGPG